MVKKVTTYHFSNRFKKEYVTLPIIIQKIFDKKFAHNKLILGNIFFEEL
jgi:hypothetical protein